MEYKGYTIRKTHQSGRHATWEVFDPENRTPWQGAVSRHPDSGVVQAIANAIAFRTRKSARAWIDDGLPPTLGPFAHWQQVVFAHTRQEARQALLRDHLRRTLTAIAGRRPELVEGVTPLTPCDNCHQALDPDFTIRVLDGDTIIDLCSWGCVAELAQVRDKAFQRLANGVARHVQSYIDEEDGP